MSFPREQEDDPLFSEPPYEVGEPEDLNHKKQVRKQLEERLERKRLREELEDELDKEFDWDAD